MDKLVYGLCAAMSLIVATMLARGFQKNKNARLLLWSSLAFAVYAVGCVYLWVDMALYPDIDWNGPLWRNFFTTVSGSLLLFGLIWEIA